MASDKWKRQSEHNPGSPRGQFAFYTFLASQAMEHDFMRRARNCDSKVGLDKTQQRAREAAENAKPHGELRKSRSESATAHPALEGVVEFGPFRLRPAERVLERDGVPLKIGSRALDVLTTLIERAPQVVSKRDLMAHAWGTLVVDEGSLRFHIAALRKILGSSKSGSRYIMNVAGRGYCFAAPVTSKTAKLTHSEGVASSPPAVRLPKRPTRVLGRDGVIRDLTRQLRERRFVSIVGPGGIGKTTVALVVAHEVLSEFAGAVHFLDLAAIKDPQLVASALASQLGVSVVSHNPIPMILALLSERSVLILLDSCEHVIEPVAKLAEELFRGAPQVHLLATSREALRTEGEWVHHLSPLECPPRDAISLTATQALSFPAVRLFVEQVEASGYPLQLSDTEAPIVADLCRRLDGIALALELAARSVGVYGIKGTASLLDHHFNLLGGRRTATPRHRTLTATLDWSHGLLSETERLVLRRLAIFVGAFSLEAAIAVVDLDAAQVTGTLARLVEKSLVSLDVSAVARYRLLDTTRAYVLEKLATSGEQKTIARRHAEYVSAALERFEAKAWEPLRAEGIDFFVSQLGNVRTALDWSFGADGDRDIGARLAAAAVPFFFQRSLLPECVAWSERALTRLAPISATPIALQLQTCFGMALTYFANSRAAEAALVQALQLAQSLEDAVSQLLLLTAIYRYKLRRGEWRELRDLASRCEAVAGQIRDPLANVVMRSIFAVTCHHLGEHVEAVRHARIACRYYTAHSYSSQLNANAAWTFNVQARSLWMLGYPDQAVEASREAIKEAEDLNHPATTVFLLVEAVLVFLYTGNWQTAEELIRRIIADSTRYALTQCHSLAIGWQGVLAVRLGEPLRGTELLQTAVARLRADGYEGYCRAHSGELAEGFLKAGETALAHTTICEAVEGEEACGPSCHMPELLRVKGEVLLSMAQSDRGEAEQCLLDSLRLARNHRALSFELRTGMSLARLWTASGRSAHALELLTSIYSRFSEGFQTSDVVSAARLLDELRSRTSSDSSS
jgi:predicted ATPase/DNA-binding winged helix-turn-helix (wHTH) protein